VVVLDDIDYDDCDGAMDGNYEDDNCDGAMDDYDDDNDVDGDGAIDDNDNDNDSNDNVVAQTPAHWRRRQHWQRILSCGRGLNNIISSYDPWLAFFGMNANSNRGRASPASLLQGGVK
jgi:hypothetical protein